MDNPCGEAKTRLVMHTVPLEAPHVQALLVALKQKPQRLPDSLIEVGLSLDVLDDLRFVLENDVWGHDLCGKEWLQDWLQNGATWREEALATPPHKVGFWCRTCWRDFHSDWVLEQHLEGKEHKRKLKTCIWKYGCQPWAAEESESQGGGAVAAAAAAQPPEQGSKGEEEARAAEDRPRDGSPVPEMAETAKLESTPVSLKGGVVPAALSGKKHSATQILDILKEEAATASSTAKRALLEYRDALSQEEREEVLKKIGLPRANDVARREDLRAVFSKEVYKQMCKVGNDVWLFREPTFSWLSGFYWHPESSRLPQNCPPHSPSYCHLCEVDNYTDQGYLEHQVCRRHSENLARWIKLWGATEVPQECPRCVQGAAGAESHSSRGVGALPTLSADAVPPSDLDCCRPAESPGVEAPEEASPPVGFASLFEVGQAGSSEPRPGHLSYVAFAITVPAGGDGAAKSSFSRKSKWTNRAAAWDAVDKICVTSTQLRIGPRVQKKAQRWGVDLYCCPQERRAQSRSVWRSLAMPLPPQVVKARDAGEERRAPQRFEFGVLVRYGGGKESQPGEEARFTVEVAKPRTGSVAVVSIDIPHWWSQCNANTGNTWLDLTGVETVPLLKFVASGQLSAMGGVAALRGRQFPVQVATEEVMLSALLYLPEAQDPTPLLLSLHGDLHRDSQSSFMPGLASFCAQYGAAAELCGASLQGSTDASWRRRRDPASKPLRSFVVVTPCSPAEHWWFRHPAFHDSTAYVPAMERWFRKLIAWLEDDLGVCPSSVAEPDTAGIRLVGQSMGGYAALELARAMPERVAAVAASAPCFDACRLDWLARRLVNVPVWMFIGRQDSMCSYGEVASLALKMQDLGARFVRLTSVGIKGHSEAYRLLERSWLYRWLLRPHTA